MCRRTGRSHQHLGNTDEEEEGLYDVFKRLHGVLKWLYRNGQQPDNIAHNTHR
jgi:hypothetical protein